MSWKQTSDYDEEFAKYVSGKVHEPSASETILGYILATAFMVFCALAIGVWTGFIPLLPTR